MSKSDTKQESANIDCDNQEWWGWRIIEPVIGITVLGTFIFMAGCSAFGIDEFDFYGNPSIDG